MNKDEDTGYRKGIVGMIKQLEMGFRIFISVIFWIGVMYLLWRILR